jgi:hypothetical protein
MYRARAGHLGVVVVDPDAIKRTGEVEPLPVKVDEVLPSVREGERELRAKVVGMRAWMGAKSGSFTPGYSGRGRNATLRNRTMSTPREPKNDGVTGGGMVRGNDRAFKAICK